MLDCAPLSRQRMRSPDRRRVVLDAACRVFAARGHDAATVREIAAAAGVTVPILYRHFASKSALHVALLGEGGDELIAHVLAVRREGTPEEFLRSTCDAFFGWVEAHPDQWGLIFRDPAADGEVAAAQAALFARARDAIASLFALTPRWALSAGLDADRGREMLAALTVSGLNGLARWWCDNQDVPREAVVATAMDLLWSGISSLGRGGPFDD